MVSPAFLAGALATVACWSFVVALAAVRAVRPGTALRAGLPAGPLVGLLVLLPLGFPLGAALAAAVPLLILFSLACVRALDGVTSEWGRHLRARFLFGVPWGTLLTVLGVALFYWVVQGGWAHPYRPLSLPFTSWSYLYPLGVLTAPFAHANLGHVTGNLIGTLVYAPLAEYAWSHYPTRRGDTSFGSWRANPFARVLAVPLVVAVVAVATSVLAWGPIIGFSGVVFAFGAFALTRYPVATVVAVAAQSFVSTVYYALRDPIVVASASPSYGGPWWAGVAVQGHATGVFLGVLLGALLVAARDDRPRAFRLWGAAVVYAASVPLYIIWWYRGPATYVLYRGLGVLFVVALALLVAAGVHARPRPLSSRIDLGVTRRQVAALCLLFPLLVTAVVAVPINLTTVADGPPANADDAVHVQDYAVTYAEDVPNKRVGAVDISLLNESTSVNASGVIVSNPDRHLWTQAVSKGSLAFSGRAAVRVGGVGWSEQIRIRRTGWTPVDAATVYQIEMTNATGAWNQVYASENATAALVVDGQHVTVASVDENFSLVVSRANRTLGRAPLPGENETTRAGDLQFRRNGTRITASDGATRVTVATKESYA
ncbi:rhomboid family intramembrane serine protease [Halarchaeum sp. P4]|uniref:rhomboid family intramembrane serine protease n=1 Tax=Halarchaeum sp. P4 TaxID=3421639 RepID=UPI003EB69F5D